MGKGNYIRRKYPNTHLTGFEIDKRAVNIAKNKGYNVYTSLKDINHIENKFDWGEIRLAYTD